MVKNLITIDDLLGLKQALLDDLQEILQRHFKPVSLPYCLARESPGKSSRSDTPAPKEKRGISKTDCR